MLMCTLVQRMFALSLTLRYDPCTILLTLGRLLSMLCGRFGAGENVKGILTRSRESAKKVKGSQKWP